MMQQVEYGAYVMDPMIGGGFEIDYLIHEGFLIYLPVCVCLQDSFWIRPL
jgi:hypothetical protein